MLDPAQETKNPSQATLALYSCRFPIIQSRERVGGGKNRLSVICPYVYGESGKINQAKNLTATGSRTKSFSASQAVIDDDIGTYPISSTVGVYSYSSGVYKPSTLSAALSAYQTNKSVTFYYDKEPEKGGCIRIIVHN